MAFQIDQIQITGKNPTYNLKSQSTSGTGPRSAYLQSGPVPITNYGVLGPVPELNNWQSGPDFFLSMLVAPYHHPPQPFITLCILHNIFSPKTEKT